MNEPYCGSAKAAAIPAVSAESPRAPTPQPAPPIGEPVDVFASRLASVVSTRDTLSLDTFAALAIGAPVPSDSDCRSMLDLRDPL